jgi:hypothetical protein
MHLPVTPLVGGGVLFANIGREAAIESIVATNNIENPSASTSVEAIAKDILTSVTRIFTDTAIDIANVVTGFQFAEDMEKAKKAMSDGGVLSSADAIEKNHYGFLKDMEKEAKIKNGEIQRLYTDGQKAELKRNKRLALLDKMLTDVDLLVQMTLEAKQLLEKATQISDSQKWAEMMGIVLPSFQEIDGYISAWDHIGKTMRQASLGINISTGLLGGVSALRMIAEASRVSSISQAARTSKFMKIGKLAGRASAVLAIASIGLDIGLSIAELEERKDKLEQYLTELNQGIGEANQDLTDLRKEVRDLDFKIFQLLQSVEPQQTEISWDNWVESTKQLLNQARSSLVSFQSIRDRAIKIAKMNAAETHTFRTSLVMSVDISISEEEAKLILSFVDGEKF